MASSKITKKYYNDSVYYAGLIVKPDSEYPDLVLYPKGDQIETRFFNYYKNSIKFDVGDNVSFSNYWGPLTAKLGETKTIFLSTDGIFNKIS